MAECARRGEKAIPEDDEVFAYAERVGIPRDLLALHWSEFKVASSQQTKRVCGVEGWRLAFRSSVRQNRFRVWAIRDDREAELGPLGRQAQRDMLALSEERSAGAGEGERDA